MLGRWAIDSCFNMSVYRTSKGAISILTFPVIAVRTIVATVTVFTIVSVAVTIGLGGKLHLVYGVMRRGVIVPSVRAARTVARVTTFTVVIPVSVSVTAIILPGGVFAGAAARRGRTAAARGTCSSALTSAVAVTATVKAPRSGRRRTSPLYTCQLPTKGGRRF